MLDFYARRPSLALACLAILCFAAVGAAVTLGAIFNLEACAMCWFQRLSFLLAGSGFLLAAIWKRGRIVIQRIGELGLLLALESAGRQSYLLTHLDAAQDNCSAGLFYYLQIGNYNGFFRAGMFGGIDCAENQPTILGLQLPEWSLVAVVCLIVLYVVWLARKACAARAGA
jgi:protein dithiol:quinone oxidoreductase